MNPLRRIGPLGAALALGQAALETRAHWGRIPLERRERLRELVGKSRGRPGNLSQRERDELRELVGGLELGELGRRLATTAAGARLRRRG